MAERVYQIAKWDEVFERAESRKLKTLSWVSFPVDLDSRGMDSLLETFGDDAPAIYGAWAALVCVAARCPQRGILAYSNAKSMSLARIAERARMPLGVMQRLWDWATTKDVAWIVVADSPGESPEVPEESPDYRTDKTGPDITDRPTDRAGVRADVRVAKFEPIEPILVSRDELRTWAPTLESIGRVVTRDVNFHAGKLKDGDRDLCALAATLAHRVFDKDWLGGVLKGIRDRKKPPDNPWGFFRKALITATTKRGENFHDIEERVKLPTRPVRNQEVAS